VKIKMYFCPSQAREPQFSVLATKGGPNPQGNQSFIVGFTELGPNPTPHRLAVGVWVSVYLLENGDDNDSQPTGLQGYHDVNILSS
jgi:hypothetical protein